MALIVALLVLAPVLVFGIRLVEKSIPSHAIRGDRVELICTYDMEGDRLYSVKWYRNGQEFYRYIPTDIPDTTVFPKLGLVVDEYRSTETRIILKRVDLATSGMFRCEVSGEAPLFQTATSNQVMVVVDLPDQGPIITGSRPKYKIEETLDANCTSTNSLPAAHLRWYINGEEATFQQIVNYPVEELPGGLQTSVLGLRLKTHKRLFHESGDLKIKCTAAIDTIYWRSNEESIQVAEERSYYGLGEGWSSGAVPIRSLAGSSLVQFYTGAFPALLITLGAVLLHI